MIRSAHPRLDPDALREWLDAITEIADTGRVADGAFTDRLEIEFAQMVGTRYAVAVSSGTAALEIAFRFAEVAHRGVGMSGTAFIAVAVAAERAGGNPVFWPVSPHTFGLDIDAAIAGVRGRGVAAVVVQHTGGLVDPRLPALLDVCRDAGVAVIEDASHAHGARLGTRGIGSLGLAGCFSLGPTKIVTAGTGGMVTTDDPRLAAFAVRQRSHGGASAEAAGPVPAGWVPVVGYGWLMSEANAALARIHLRRLPENLRRRRAIAALYHDILAVLGAACVTPPRFETVAPAWWKFPILLPTIEMCQRVWGALDAAEIGVGALYWPPAFDRRWRFEGPVDRTQDLLLRHLALPVHPGLSDDDIAAVCATIVRALVPRPS